MHLKPKKRLGQNFLTDKNIQKKIIEACELDKADSVLEIGAGRGEMTGLLSERAAYVYALEIDPDLYKVLKNSLKEYNNVKIINQDILKFDFRKYFGKIKNKIKVVGNIPYYITTPIIERLLEFKDNIKTVFITVQKEFALRIVAGPGSKDYGSLSCYIQYHTEPEIMFFIKNTCFSPSPKVDSCLLRLKVREKPAVKVGDEKMFFKIIRAAFNQRRKTLRNSLKDIISEEKLEIFFKERGIDKNIRPERLGLSDFANLV